MGDSREEEAIKTWSLAKTLDVNNPKEQEVIKELRRSKRLILHGGEKGSEP